LVGADGATHHGAFDLSYLRCVPGITIMTPADENECRQMLFTALSLDGPTAVRYPRGTGPGVEVMPAMKVLTVGRGEMRREGRHVAILSFGALLKPALEAGNELNATVANMRFVKPLDRDLVVKLATSHELLVTVEENVVMGGAGSAVLELLAAEGLEIPVLQLGLPDRFVEHGDPQVLLADCGLDRDGIVRSVRERRAKSASRPGKAA
jgi:1-deoxy-D-xylulose-5-phosphate synthase